MGSITTDRYFLVTASGPRIRKLYNLQQYIRGYQSDSVNPEPHYIWRGIVGVFFFFVLFSLFVLPPEIGMERPDPDCTLNIEKILVGNDLGIKLHNTVPDVPTVGLTSILHLFTSSLSLKSSAGVFFLIASSLLPEALKING